MAVGIEQYQAIAETAIVKVQSDPAYKWVVKDLATLNGGCQYVAAEVFRMLRENGEDPHRLHIDFTFYDGTRVGTHIAVRIGENIIDPSITQYVETGGRFVFPRSKYPLCRIARVVIRDINEEVL